MNFNPVFRDHLGRPIEPPAPEKLVKLKAVKVAITLLIAAPLLMAAATQINLATQVKGILPGANGGLNANAGAFTGILREASGTGSAAELSGDATTSGSNVVTVAKVDGTSVPTNSAANQILVTTASATGGWSTIPNCTSGALQYNNTTQAFSCGAVLTGTFSDAETPSGSINGSNTSFTLAHTPNPSADLQLYLNGQQLIAGGSDYTLSTATITMTAAPKTGDVLIAFYRY
ncbi:MAG: hypothetical protein ABSE45_14970 [Candidatus Acidiferrales bacterium]|jgi:hypothetical protein